jgi:hypothetical protein
MKPCTHFVGFRGNEYHSAVKIFGKPDFYHPKFDIRAKADITEGDTVVFANGTEIYCVLVRQH